MLSPASLWSLLDPLLFFIFKFYSKKQEFKTINPILDGVRAHPILDGGGGKKASPRLTLRTMKLGRNTV